MASFNFITVRLGKDSLPDIEKICKSDVGILKDSFEVNVKCTQIPDNYKSGDYAFIWLGSDNNKGTPTKWKQGFKAVGRVKSIIRGKKYNDTSETKIDIVYVFKDAINRLDILRSAPIAYYWCSSLPLIGIDDHANQTIRSMSGDAYSDIRAFFIVLESATKSFRKDIVQIEPAFNAFFKLILPSPQKYPSAQNIDALAIQSINKNKNKSLQRIFYGAPGTGKSHEIKTLTEGKSVIRTTFHPDSDYSTFVGAYKPVMEECDVKVTPLVIKNGVSLEPSGTYKERRISYRFVKQAFLKAYLGAWKKFVDSRTRTGVPQNNKFTINKDEYTITKVDNSEILFCKVFPCEIRNNSVNKAWDEIWTSGSFSMPKGPQSGKSLQQAIAQWINDNVQNCTSKSLDEGLSKLQNELDQGKEVEVRKEVEERTSTKTYVLHKKGNQIFARTNSASKKDTIKDYYNGQKPESGEKELLNRFADMLKDIDNQSFDNAWTRLKETINNNTNTSELLQDGSVVAPQFLVIEEINRGNCAQIFGDLFQLLDRSDNGFSEYPIESDTDLQQEIERAFKEEYVLTGNINIEGVVKGYTSNYDATLSEDVQSGCILLLPPNLYIWATMNTSDQSLFPIDSAFKRRWDWEYMPIGYKNTNWTIKIGTKKYKWVDFQKEINNEIYNVDNSEDKQLGDYFVNAERTNNVISADTLLNKILFYLWNDVCKDDPDRIFKWKDDKDNGLEKSIKFSDFFCEEEEKDRKLQGFMAFLKIDAIDEGEETNESNDDNSETGGKRFAYNGTVSSLREIAASVVSDYAKVNSGMNAQQVRDYFMETFNGIGIAHIVETESEYRHRDGQSSQQRTVTPVTIPNGENLYVSTQWRAGNESDNFYRFMEIVNEKGLGTIKLL